MDSNEDSAEKDSGPELQINLPESVMSRIEELMGGTDEFDSADFDPVAYINRLFPTEQSLAGIEAAIAKCEYRLASARSDSRRLLQEQTQQRECGQEALLQAQRLYKELATQISDINSKAERSESVVRSITSEMKLLDRGKSNLTAAVAGLTHQRLLRDAAKQLSVLAPNRDYQQLATTLPATMQVLEQLSGYSDIEPIRVLRDEVYTIRDELAKQILTDFKQTFTGGSNPLSHRSLAAACLVVDQLQPRVRKELVDWFTDMQLQEYSALFSPEQESAAISQVDRRYSWLKRHLVAFEKSLATVFPLPWKISHRIAVQFCERTRNALTEQLSMHRSQLDVQTLVQAVTQTRNFENLLEKRFQDPDAEENNQSSTEKPETEGNDLTDVQNYKWMNSISVCFEPHLSIYVNSVDATLRTLMDQLIQESKAESPDSNENSSLTACGRLLSVYKQALLQCTKLSHGQALIELSRVFGKYLQEFAGSVLGGGAAGKAALNVPTLLSTLLKDDTTHRYTRQEINRLTDAITTAEYCLESTIHLEKKLREKVTPTNAKRIDFSLEQDLFHKTINNCIQLLVQDLELACEPALQTMTKISWLNFDTVGDQSSYITQLTMHLKNYIPTLRDSLNNSRKYFTQFCVRFANSFIPKFISNLFKCKPISTVGSEQLLLDTHMLKTVLLELPSLGLDEKRLAPATYTKVVIKLMSKAEMILKLVMAPVDLLNMESFVQQFVQLLPESNLSEFHKVFDMKGVKLSKSQLGIIDGMFRNISAKVSSELK